MRGVRGIRKIRNNLTAESDIPSSQSHKANLWQGCSSAEYYKMLTPVFHGTIQNNVLKVYHADRFKMWLEKLNGKNIELVIKKKSAHRSGQQNKYYWACLNIIGQDTGESAESLHESFKQMFLLDRTKKIPVARSTIELNKIEFGEYFEKIKYKVAEIGIILPEPDDTDPLFYNREYLEKMKQELTKV